jgi:hypothetical protein
MSVASRLSPWPYPYPKSQYISNFYDSTRCLTKELKKCSLIPCDPGVSCLFLATKVDILDLGNYKKAFV